MPEASYHNPQEERLNRPALQHLQHSKLALMLETVLESNRFYQRKFRGIRFKPLRDAIERLPFTTRSELELDQMENPPYGSNLTFERERYCRVHQTSGTNGHPLRWLDTPDSWNWWKECWATIYAAAGITREDRLAFTFSFGPFIRFWSAFEGATSLGRMCLAGGGMSTSARLRMIRDNGITVIGCTPSYALHMAEAARQEGLDARGWRVRAIIVAGEPGGHIPAVRERIEKAWGARVFDHSGMTEIGPMGFECVHDPGSVHLMENQCIAEVIDPRTLRNVPDGEIGELVITNLGRWGSPVIRYRTGDQVKLTRERCACGRWFARMQGGILGRTDDMFIVRGNNVFPSAIEEVVRRFNEVAEFGVEVTQDGPLAQVRVKIEPADDAALSNDLAERVAQALQNALSFRAEVVLAERGTLPRFEMKGRRFERKLSLRQ